MGEIWKDIKEYEGLYRVSNLGNVKSWHTHKTGKKGKCLSPKLTPSGYYKVNLYKDHIQKTFSIHQLVANEFIPNKENKKGVNHIDGNKLNNRLNNLEWATDLENMTHAIKNGLVNNAGEHNGFSKLTDSQVLEIDQLLSTNTIQQKDIAILFNVSKMTISLIKHRKRWMHLFNNRDPLLNQLATP